MLRKKSSPIRYTYSSPLEASDYYDRKPAAIEILPPSGGTRSSSVATGTIGMMTQRFNDETPPPLKQITLHKSDKMHPRNSQQHHQHHHQQPQRHHQYTTSYRSMAQYPDYYPSDGYYERSEQREFRGMSSYHGYDRRIMPQITRSFDGGTNHYHQHNN